MTEANLLSATLEAAIGTVAALCQANGENEETFTGALLGALATAGGVLASFDQTATGSPIWWGSYRKFSGGEFLDSEAGSGADFALLLVPEPGQARLAIFQAKRFEVHKDDEALPLLEARQFVDFNRIPPKTKDGKQREPQMFVLVETGRRIFAAVTGRAYHPNLRIDLAQKFKDPTVDVVTEGGLHKLDWIHYLIYTQGAPRSVPLCELGSAYKKEVLRKKSPTRYELPGQSEPVLELLARGPEKQHKGWLSLGFEEAVSHLPSLTNLMPVIVGDGTGTFGPFISQEKDANPSIQHIPLSMGDSALADFIANAKRMTPHDAPAPKPRKPNF